MDSSKGTRIKQFEKYIATPMTKEEKSAIIGYWRSGVKTDLIAAWMGISEVYVEMIINDYKKTINE